MENKLTDKKDKLGERAGHNSQVTVQNSQVALLPKLMPAADGLGGIILSKWEKKMLKNLKYEELMFYNILQILD